MGIFDCLVFVLGDCSRPHEQQPAAFQGGDEQLDDYTALRRRLCLYEQFDLLIGAVHRWREEKLSGLAAAPQPSLGGEEEQDQVADNTALRHQLCLSEEEFADAVAAFNGMRQHPNNVKQFHSYP